MAFVDTFFAAAWLSVRFRWAIVLAWVAGTVAAMALLPSLSSVTQSDNTSFLPGGAPSEQAAQLASPLQGATLTAVTVVAGSADGTLTGADQAFVARLAGSLSRLARVASVRDAGQSADGRAEQLTVLATLAQSGGLAASQQASLVAALRDVIRSAGPPPGLSVHTAGTVATRVDTNAIVGSGSAGAQNVRTIVNVGVGLALGVLMDTFLVRTLLVPSAVVLIGRWNWWPSALSPVPPADAPSGDPDASFTTYKLLLKMGTRGIAGSD